MNKFNILKDYTKIVKRFNLHGRTIEFNIKPVPTGEDPAKWIRDSINQMILFATQHVEPTDKIGFTFCSKDFKKGQGWKNFMNALEVDVDDVWNVISGIFQSNSMGLNTDTFCLGVTTVRFPKGRGNIRQSKYNSYEEECACRKGIIVIKNNDNLCLPRALVVAIGNITKDCKLYDLRRDRKKLQYERAAKLMDDASVKIPEDEAGIEELQQFQNYFGDKYRICVYLYGSKGRDIMFEGSGTGPMLNLIYHKGHYNVIISLTAAFCCSYYCEKCHIPYNAKNNHGCGGTCHACLQSPSCLQEKKIQCHSCGRRFKSENCFQNHKKPNSFGKKSVCSQITCCSICLKTIKSDRTHYCGEIFCKICHKHMLGDHLCFMQPDTTQPKLENFLFVFYDLETRQEKVIDDKTVEHEPNLCVFKQCCDKCIGNKNLSICDKCGVRLQKLKNNVIEGFVTHILQLRKKFKNVVVIAHNGQSFDHQFVLNHLLTKTDLTPELIMRGTKIISMIVGNVKFLDSLNYFPMPLAKLPKAFGLSEELKKGYFPHLFNRLENENYIGALPDVSYYSPDNMKKEERNAFLKWYEDHKNDEFNMQRELVDYCVSDVEILTEACLKFRVQLLETGNVCPFTEECTIASACNKVYRRNFLNAKTIGIIPRNGYRFVDNQSKIATQWLVWEEYSRKINIIHSAKQKEVKIGGLKVDGYCEETKQIFEFHGCYFHGHPNCIKLNRDAPINKDPLDTFNQRYESTLAKTKRLESLGYNVFEMWECDFRRQMQLSPEIEEFTNSSPVIKNSALNPRDSFYGGRTGNTKTYYKSKEGEKIHYIDICSLYPYVCKYGKYPVGHPTVYVGNECPKKFIELEGIIKCTILPPQNLYHPVLPAKINNKLMFTLCKMCADIENKDDCTHTDLQRCITGTWVIDEVKKAVEKGYKILEVHEFWKYEFKQFNSEKKIYGLFTEMMNKFLKIKQQASGWPKNCETIDQKQAYIEEFLQQECIRLEFSEIKENPGLRALAKLILNSFWGKLGQRENQPKTKIINNPSEFFSMMSNPIFIVNTVLPINDNTLVVNYEHTEESYDILSTVNVFLAAYTTTQARLKLYSYLEQLDERVLYYDTDSVIFISKPGDNDPLLGNCVGDMTDELAGYGPGSYITEFASGGPKNYGYVVYSPTKNTYTHVCKVKGICINHEIEKDVNFSALKDMVKNKNFEGKKIAYKNIRRTKLHEVVTCSEEKIFRPTSRKRKFNDCDSIPYGYINKKYLQANS